MVKSEVQRQLRLDRYIYRFMKTMNLTMNKKIKKLRARAFCRPRQFGRCNRKLLVPDRLPTAPRVT